MINLVDFFRREIPSFSFDPDLLRWKFSTYKKSTCLYIEEVFYYNAVTKAYSLIDSDIFLEGLDCHIVEDVSSLVHYGLTRAEGGHITAIIGDKAIKYYL